MIVGAVVESLRPAIPLNIRRSPDASNGQEIAVLIDTGFNGFLALPTDLAASMGLPANGMAHTTLADGQQIFLPVYSAVVDWDGQPRQVDVVVSDGVPLIGMSLLEGSRLTIDATDGGRVSIEPLP